MRTTLVAAGLGMLVLGVVLGRGSFGTTKGAEAAPPNKTGRLIEAEVFLEAANNFSVTLPAIATDDCSELNLMAKGEVGADIRAVLFPSPDGTVRTVQTGGFFMTAADVDGFPTASFWTDQTAPYVIPRIYAAATELGQNVTAWLWCEPF